MNIVLIEGFSATKGSKRLKVLADEIEERFPMEKVFTVEYFEKYGKIGKFLRKKTIPNYADVVLSQIPKNIFNPIIIGYSMGGIIARYLVEKIRFQAREVILVGTPNKGIKLSTIERLLPLPQCVKDIEENSNFLSNLNLNLTGNAEKLFFKNYYFIGSKSDKRVPLESSIPIRIAGKFFILDTTHSNLIPRTKSDISESAVPVILEILQKTINNYKVAHK